MCLEEILQWLLDFSPLLGSIVVSGVAGVVAWRISRMERKIRYLTSQKAMLAKLVGQLEWSYGLCLNRKDTIGIIKFNELSTYFYELAKVNSAYIVAAYNFVYGKGSAEDLLGAHDKAVNCAMRLHGEIDLELINLGVKKWFDIKGCEDDIEFNKLGK